MCNIKFTAGNHVLVNKNSEDEYVQPLLDKLVAID